MTIVGENLKKAWIAIAGAGALMGASISSAATVSTGVSIKFSGSAFWTTTGVDTPYEFVVHWNPSQAGYWFNKSVDDRVYYHSFRDGTLNSPGLTVAARIGGSEFVFSSEDSTLGRSLVNLIDQPGDQLDRFTLLFGEPDSGWDFLMLEFASVSNDSLVQPGPGWDSAAFDFTGDYIVTRVRYHRWGQQATLIDDAGDVTLSVVPEPSSSILVIVGGLAVAARRRVVRALHV